MKGMKTELKTWRGFKLGDKVLAHCPPDDTKEVCTVLRIYQTDRVRVGLTDDDGVEFYVDDDAIIRKA